MWPFGKKNKKDSGSVEQDGRPKEYVRHPDCRHVWKDDGFVFCTIPDETIPQHCIICGDLRITQRPRGSEIDFSGYTDSGLKHSYKDAVDDSLLDAMFNKEIVTFIDENDRPMWRAIVDSQSSLRAEKSIRP